MSLLRDIPWELDCHVDTGDLARAFYTPALRCAARYDHLTGYFSARVLAIAAPGVEGIVRIVRLARQDDEPGE